MVLLIITNIVFALEVVYIPYITDQPYLSKMLNEALSLQARERSRFILTEENANIYMQKKNLDATLFQLDTPLEQAKALQAKHLVLASYEQKENTHILKTVLYRSDLASMQASISIKADSLDELSPKLPTLAEQLLSYTFIEEGVTDPLAYPLVDIPSGAYMNNGKRENISGFQMGKFEVSQVLYMAVMNENPSRREDCDRPYSGQSLHTPVSCVSIFDAAQFTNVYSQRMGKTPCYEITRDQITKIPKCTGFRLPSSQEWFYAASLMSSKKFSGSDDASTVAWTQENSQDMLHQIGKKSPNAAGIHDLSGNVAEWTETFENGEYIVRGGSYQQVQENAQISKEAPLAPELLLQDQGFRIVLPFQP